MHKETYSRQTEKSEPKKFAERKRFSLACGKLYIRNFHFGIYLELEYGICNFHFIHKTAVEYYLLAWKLYEVLLFIREQVVGRTNYDDFVYAVCMTFFGKLHPEYVQRMSMCCCYCCGYRYNCWLLHLFVLLCGSKTNKRTIK